MDEKTVLTRYARYFDALREIATKPFDGPLKIDNLNISRSLIQTGYRDMKRDNFEGELIYYFCWISTQYIIALWKKTDTDLESLHSILSNNISDTRNLIRLVQYYPKYYRMITSVPKNLIEKGVVRLSLSTMVSSFIMIETHPEEKISSILKLLKQSSRDKGLMKSLTKRPEKKGASQGTETPGSKET